VFNMSGTEVMVLLVLGLVVLGPEKLPDAIRRVGQLYSELKRMSGGVQGDLRRAFDEPLRELRATGESAKKMVAEAASPFANATLSAAPPVRPREPLLSLADGGTQPFVETEPGALETADATTPPVDAAAPPEPSEHALDDVT
jgi:sec-independent protein translocase protein TatB